MLFGYAFAKASTTALQQDTTNIARKVYRATRISTPPKIDGKPFEQIWDRVTTGGNFVMAQPNNGDAERDTHKTEFKIAYDDAAIYVAGFMYDSDPESVLRQFSQRDQVFEQADLFGFFINTYNNQINQTRFYATSANALGDAIAEGNSQDFSYNVVFLSEVSFDERGWYVEMKIPYRTLRFPEQDVQDWSFQILRVIKSLNEEYTYNYLDVTTGTDTQYDALLTGIENIDPPLRLNLYPYVSVIHDRFDGIESTSFNAGMDLKYGINDAFTLDATLIPDFGQVAFDQVVLNLGPFEQTFNENRAFFTEGTDLFRKGDLFFSRRIGQRPSGSRNLEVLDDEDIIDNPRSAQLLNAIKVTGRFKRLNEKEHNYDFRVAPRYRFSDQFLLIYSLDWDKNNDRMSYVTLTDDNTTSILSERDTHSVENRLTGTYNFNNRQALSISFRNFWSRAIFSRDFKELQLDGSLEDSDYVLEEDFNPDANFNVWNLDLSYRWRFAPGSEASLLYRNSISNFDNQGNIQFEESLDNLFMEPVRHNLSLRVTYFLDVNAARKWFKA
ncbi:hypothetical protein JCM19297_1586 [Nonlabens ulvanivorans]|nr:hypothetical protein JCM19297_1586 [Nonlabens ulvanivorans]